WILYKRGVYQRAVDLLKESAAKLPDQPVVQYHLGVASLKAGDKQGARKALTAAINSPGSFPEKDEARKALAEIQEVLVRQRREPRSAGVLAAPLSAQSSPPKAPIGNLLHGCLSPISRTSFHTGKGEASLNS